MNPGVIYLLVWLVTIAVGYGIEQYRKQQYKEQHGSLDYDRKCEFFCKIEPWKEHWMYVGLFLLIFAPIVLGYFCRMSVGMMTLIAPLGVCLFVLSMRSEWSSFIIYVALALFVIQITSLFMTKCN